MISVIIPTYNYGKYLASSLDSVFSQMYSPIEVIVVDNASTDETTRILEPYYERIVYLKMPENGGAGAGRNQGVLAAKGTYLAFLDADDLWLPNKLSLQKNALLMDPYPHMVFGHIQNFYSPELSLTTRSRLKFTQSAMIGVVPSVFFIRKEHFLDVGFFDPTLKAGEFIEWYARAEKIGLVTKVLPDVLALRRVHEGHLGKSTYHQEYCRILKKKILQKQMELKLDETS